MAATIRPAALLLLAVAVGCGSGSSEPVTYPVTGKVTIGGAPVTGADVSFVPQSADLGIGGATAHTGADGTFSVTVPFDLGKSSKEGLPAGDYRIFVIKLEQQSGPPSLSKPPKNTLHQKYASPDTSNLSATVKADGENFVELKLE